mgnify:CR=1 FL=1
MSEEEIKTIYSDEVISILNDIELNELLKETHELRSKILMKGEPLKKASNIYVIIQALKMYVRQKKGALRNKLKRESKNGS